MVGHPPPAMRWTVLLSFAFLLACPGETPEPEPAEPPTAAPEPTPEATPEPTPEATPEPTPEPAGDPWVLTEPGPIVDELQFLGWSADGRRYAYQLAIAAQGAECSARYELFVVDAATDSFVEGGKVEIKHDSPEGGPDGCSPASLEPGLAAAKDSLLPANGIRVGHWTQPSRLTLREQGLWVAKVGDREVRFTFIVRHGVHGDPYGEGAKTGAAYVLTLHSGAEPRVIEAGQRRRPWVLDYSIDNAPVFLSPDGVHAAVFVRRSHTAFEGVRTSWMTNGLRLPEAS